MMLWAASIKYARFSWLERKGNLLAHMTGGLETSQTRFG